MPADGYRRNGLWLAKQGFAVTAVDVSSIGVERTRSRAKQNGVSPNILLGGLNAWAWSEEEFDAVASIYLHLPPDQRTSIYQHMFQSLKSGRILILEAFPIAIFLRQPKQVELLYTEAILRREFPSVDALELAEIEVELN